MPDINEQKNQEKLLNCRVHMANERTFLAWIRTSIGIMAFGFVVEKFALFMKQCLMFWENHPLEKLCLLLVVIQQSSEYSLLNWAL